jgi:hypothetical protein
LASIAARSDGVPNRYASVPSPAAMYRVITAKLIRESMPLNRTLAVRV